MGRTAGRPRRRAGLSAARVLIAAAAGAAAGGAAAGAATPAGAPRPVSLPRDHGAHAAAGVEWWYVTARTTAAGGRPYFWLATIWSSPLGAVGRVHVVDLRRDRVVLDGEWARRGRFAAGARDLAVGGLRIRWQRDGELGRLTVDARAGGAGRLRATLRPLRPYALHGRRGIVPQGPAATSAYYSATRAGTRATLRAGGGARRLRGPAWFDHQWGDFGATPGALRWDWFACQLADGRDLMLTQFLRPDGRALPAPRHGTLVRHKGGAVRLRAFTATPLGRLVRPPGARARYPRAWRLRVPAAGLDLTLRARGTRQYVVNRYVPDFWEGPAAIVRGPRGACTVESSREAFAGP